MVELYCQCRFEVEVKDIKFGVRSIKGYTQQILPERIKRKIISYEGQFNTYPTADAEFNQLSTPTE